MTDPALGDWMVDHFQVLDARPMIAVVHLEVVVGLFGALLVMLIVELLARKHAAALGVRQKIGRQSGRCSRAFRILDANQCDAMPVRRYPVAVLKKSAGRL